MSEVDRIGLDYELMTEKERIKHALKGKSFDVDYASGGSHSEPISEKERDRVILDAFDYAVYHCLQAYAAGRSLEQIASRYIDLSSKEGFRLFRDIYEEEMAKSDAYVYEKDEDNGPADYATSDLSSPEPAEAEEDVKADGAMTSVSDVAAAIDGLADIAEGLPSGEGSASTEFPHSLGYRWANEGPDEVVVIEDVNAGKSGVSEDIVPDAAPEQKKSGFFSRFSGKNKRR